MPLDGLDDPSKYGQVRTSGNLVTAIKEKPRKVFSDRIQTGVWLFNRDAFDAVRAIERQKHPELGIGYISAFLARRGSMTHTHLMPKSYIDAGTPQALERASSIAKKMNAGTV